MDRDNVRDLPLALPVQTAEVRAALHERLGLEGYKTLDEVRHNGPGRSATRTIDVLGIRFKDYEGPQSWELLACEIKISRGDFLQDIRRPEKQDPWREAAHKHAYIVPSGLVARDEVPAGSGLAEIGIRQYRREGFQHYVLRWTVQPPRAARTVPGWLLAGLVYRCSTKYVADRSAEFLPREIPASVLEAW